MRTGTGRPVDRASDADLAFLAMDVGRPPQQLGAVLILDGALDEGEFARRIARVPRLRQRLRRTPPGCGRPVWVDDDRFAPARHVGRARWPAPGDEAAL